jgi:hypothetical protein
MIQKWVLLDVEMDQRKQVIDQLFLCYFQERFSFAIQKVNLIVMKVF